MSQGGNPRRERVAQAMRDQLAAMLDREVKDPRVREAGFVSINHVELNSDMSVARVFVSFLGAKEKAVSRAMAGLEAASGFLRGPLGRRLKLRHAPNIRFVYDDTPAFHQRLTELVRADESRADESRADEVRADGVRADEVRADGVRADGARADGDPSRERAEDVEQRDKD